MSSKQILWTLFALTLVAPCILYIVINGYWWMFGHNELRPDRMGVALIISVAGLYALDYWAIEGNVWRNS